MSIALLLVIHIFHTFIWVLTPHVAPKTLPKVGWALYKYVFRRNSTFIGTMIIGAILAEGVVSWGVDSFWNRANKGVCCHTSSTFVSRLLIFVFYLFYFTSLHFIFIFPFFFFYRNNGRMSRTVMKNLISKQ